MPRICARKFVWMLALTLALGACGRDKEPAQVQLGEIEGTVSAAAADAAKYVPDQLTQVREELRELHAAFDNQDYAAVLAGSPAVLRDAQGLAAAAGAAKTAAMTRLNEQWSRLSVTLPSEVSIVQKRIDQLAKQSSKKRPASVDLEAAKAGLADAASLWSKAQAAFAGDNLREAVSTANSVGSKLESLAATLQLDFGTAS